MSDSFSTASVLWNIREPDKVVCLEVDNEFLDFLCHVLQQPLHSVVAFLAETDDVDQRQPSEQTATVAPYARLYASLCGMKPSMLRATDYPIHEGKPDLDNRLFRSCATLTKSDLFPSGAAESAALRLCFPCRNDVEEIKKRIKLPSGREFWIPLTIRELVEDFNSSRCLACTDSLDGDWFPNFLSEYKPSLAHQGSECRLEWGGNSSDAVTVAGLVKRAAAISLYQSRPFSVESLVKEPPIFKENLEFLVTPKLNVVKSTMVNSFAIMKEAGVEPKDLRSATVTLTRQAVAKLIRNMLSADCCDAFKGVFDIETPATSGSPTPIARICSDASVEVVDAETLATSGCPTPIARIFSDASIEVVDIETLATSGSPTPIARIFSDASIGVIDAETLATSGRLLLAAQPQSPESSAMPP